MALELGPLCPGKEAMHIMRRPARREVVLVGVLVVVGVLGVITYRRAPKSGLEDVAEVKEYFVKAFSSAERITMRPADGGEGAVVERSDSPHFFRRLEELVGMGIVSITPPGTPIKYQLDLELSNGKRIEDVAVSLFISAPKQPAKGELWFIPRHHGPIDETPEIVTHIDRYLESLHGEGEEAAEPGEQ
jgi:hypothetical protein